MKNAINKCLINRLRHWYRTSWGDNSFHKFRKIGKKRGEWGGGKRGFITKAKAPEASFFSSCMHKRTSADKKNHFDYCFSVLVLLSCWLLQPQKISINGWNGWKKMDEREGSRWQMEQKAIMEPKDSVWISWIMFRSQINAYKSLLLLFNLLLFNAMEQSCFTVLNRSKFRYCRDKN